MTAPARIPTRISAARPDRFDQVPMPRELSDRIRQLYRKPEPLTAEEWAEWERLSDEGNG